MDLRFGLKYANFEKTFSKLIRSDGTLNKYIYAVENLDLNYEYQEGLIPPQWSMITSKDTFDVFFDFNSNAYVNYDPNSILNHFGIHLVLNYAMLNFPSLNL